MITITIPHEKIEKTKQSIENFVNEIPDIIFEVAGKAADMVQNRVEGQGLAVNGSFLDTPSSNPIGRYGQRHGKAREKKGLSVSKVDLSFTGQMWNSWKEEKGVNQTGVGFNNDEARFKAQANEDLYDTPIFIPSEVLGERAKTIQNIKDKIREKFKM